LSTQFKPLEIPPGVVAQPTKRMRSSNWSEVNLMRWVEGKMAPVGGQAQYTYSFASRCKAIHGWYGLDGVYYTAYLCEENLYVDAGGELFDISPIPPLVAPTLGQGGYGDGLYSNGDYGVPTTGGSLIPIDQLPDAWSLDNFGQILLAMTSPDARLLQWDPANGDPGVVASIAAYQPWGTNQATIAMLDVNPGAVAPGMDVYNQTSGLQVGVVESWPPASPTLTLTANALSAGAANDVLGFGNVATIVAGAPHGRCFVVTPERFVQMFGTTQDGTSDGGSFRRFGWCDQENFNAWNYSVVTSQAGYLDIEPASPIVTAHSTRNGTIFWTGKKAYVVQFLGLPYIYNYVELADNCTPWSPCSVTSTSSMSLWMSQQGMFSFDGTSVLPVQCNVRPWVDSDIDWLNVREQACAVHISSFNEFWWFFPQNGQPYNTRAIIYNYKEGWWSQAQMSRSAGITSSYTVQPILADGLVAFEHELGDVYGNAQLPWAQTFDLNILGGGGGLLTTVKQMIPDVGGAVSSLLYSLLYSNSRSMSNGQPVIELQTTPKPVRADGFLDLRATGRDIRLQIQVAGPSVLPVTVGQHLIDAVPRGDR
jgi:hypothetical protein